MSAVVSVYILLGAVTRYILGGCDKILAHISCADIKITMEWTYHNCFFRHFMPPLFRDKHAPTTAFAGHASLQEVRLASDFNY